MSIYKRGGTWWVDVAPPNGGRRIRRSTETGDRAAALRIHDEFKAELWRQRRSGRTLYGALDAWSEGKGYPDQKRIGKIKRLFKDQPLDSLDVDGLLSILPKKPGTFNRYLTILSAAGVKLLVDGERVKPKKGAGSRLRWLTADEWTKLRAELPAWQVPMADIAIATGLRQANVLRMRWEWIDLRGKLMIVPAKVLKARKPLRVKLEANVTKILKAQRGIHPEWVFVSEKKPEQPPTEIKVGWAAAQKRAKIEHVTWHDLRHTWATWHVLNGTPLRVLQELGGWADARMVNRYAHMAESHADQYAGNARPYQPRNGTKARHKAA